MNKVAINGIWYRLYTEEKKAEVTFNGNTKYKGRITIPKYIEYYGDVYHVTSIGLYAFVDCTHLTSIVIPESVTTIEYRAFYGCTGLTSIVIPEGVTDIFTQAFAKCSNLAKVSLPKSLKLIDDGVFAKCTSLSSITLHEGLREIGTDPLPWCLNGLEEELPNISEDTSFTGAFEGCINLTSILIPESVNTIGPCAFYGCTNLESITLPSNLSTICNEAFSHCSKLHSCCIPDRVSYIGYNAFAGCIGLDSITIPASMTRLEHSCFDGARLRKIIIHKGVVSIDPCFFTGCEGTSVYCWAEEVPELDAVCCEDLVVLKTISLFVPENLIDKYQKLYWRFESIIPFKVFKDSIKLESSTIELYEEDVCTLKARFWQHPFNEPFAPNTATDIRFLWSTNNEDVAMVNNKGRIVAIAPGVATIMVKASDSNDLFAECQVIVRKKKEISLNHSSITLSEGKTFFLSAHVNPAEALLTWETKDEDVAMVNSKGRVVAISAGITEIVVAINDSSEVRDTCQVIVTKKV